MIDCVFCKIAKGEIPCAKIWEDENYLAFLDINPNTKGMSLVIPKKHFDSYAADMDDKDYCNLMIAAKKVRPTIPPNLAIPKNGELANGVPNIIRVVGKNVYCASK